MYIYDNICEFLLEWEMFQTKVIEKIKTHILCSITFLRKSCRLWDNVEKYDIVGQAAVDNIIWRMRIACWITKATDAHPEYCFCAFRMVTRTRLNVTLYLHCLPCMSCFLLTALRIIPVRYFFAANVQLNVRTHPQSSVTMINVLARILHKDEQFR
jgi:hypothetical protein